MLELLVKGVGLKRGVTELIHVSTLLLQCRQGKGALYSLCLQHLPEEVLKDQLLMTGLSTAHHQVFCIADMHSWVLHAGLQRVVW